MPPQLRASGTLAGGLGFRDRFFYWRTPSDFPQISISDFHPPLGSYEANARLSLCIRLPRLCLASLRSWRQCRPLSDTTQSGPRAHRYLLQRSPRRRPYPRPTSPALPAPSHPIPQSPLSICSPQPPAHRPAKVISWNHRVATIPPAGLGLAAEISA